MNSRAYCARCHITFHRSESVCPQCKGEIHNWKCGSCGNILSRTSDDRCHNYHANAYDSQGSNFQRPADTLNPWKY